MKAARKASPDLEAFIDKGIQASRAHGYHPTIFIDMRGKYGTLEAMERLVKNGEIQTGFTRLHQMNLLEWSVEFAIIKFADEFTSDARQCAQWRLDQVRSKKPT